MRDVLLAQFHATGSELRWALTIAAATGVLATVLLAFQVASGDWAIKPHSEPSLVPAAIGALLAIAVWAREDRFGPAFLWTLPVDRTRHALIKVLAGWLWLMGGVALYALCRLVLVGISGARVLPVEVLHVLAAPVPVAGPLDPEMIRTVRWAPGATVWAVPFVGATATYLLVSAFMLGIRRPLRWGIGVVALIAGLSVASHLASRLLGLASLADAPSRAQALLVDGRYGLEALLTLRTWSLDSRATLTTGEQIHVWSALPDIGDWRIAALLWTGLGLLAVWVAVSRHRERRRA
jgi:hypothetical protein